MAKKKDDKDKPESLAEDLLIREVDEDLRAEQLQKFWKKYGNILLSGVALVIVASAGFQFSKHLETSQAEEQTMALLNAQELAEDEALEQASEALKEIAHTDDAFGVIARLRKAYLDYEISENIESFTAVAAQSTLPVAADVAKLQMEHYEEIPETSPFNALSEELIAIRLWHEGKTEEAKQRLTSLQDGVNTSARQKRRIEQILEGIE